MLQLPNFLLFHPAF